MKLRKGLYIAGLCGALVFGAVSHAFLQASEPGSPNDPLVTQSYVHQLVNQAVGAALGQGGTGQGAQAPQANVFEPIQVLAGQILIGHEGTEIILRAGSAIAVIPGEAGIVNATAGVDITNGAIIPTNHYLIVPRDDGRGILALTTAYFMVKGSFSIITH